MCDSFPDGENCVYILRCRYERSAERSQWRFLLENPRTGWHRGFGTPLLLVGFLQRAFTLLKEGGPEALPDQPGR